MSGHRYWRFIFAFSLFLAVGCHKQDDNSITTQIQAKMFSEPLLKSASVNVTTKDGIVTLSGAVPDDAARLAAQSIASNTNGVKQVIDSLSVASIVPVAASTPPPPAPAPVTRKSASKKQQPAPPISDEEAPSVTSVDSMPAAAPTPPAAPPTPVAPAAPVPPPPPQPITVTIPEGTVVTIRTTDPIDSSTSSAGQLFRASLDGPVVVNDRIVLPKGLNVSLKLVQASSAGKFSGRSELTVSLESITYQGKTYSLSTSDVQQQGASRGQRSAAVIGGGAALGALIGGLAGGGRGAAIGAGVGAGGGTAVQASTKGQQVKIPAETRLDFTLRAAVPVTQKSSPAPESATPSASPANADPSMPPTSSQTSPSYPTQPSPPPSPSHP